MRMPSAKVVTLIEVEFCTGSGVDGDPYRSATAYFRENGEYVCCTDPTVPHGKIETLMGKRPIIAPDASRSGDRYGTGIDFKAD